MYALHKEQGPMHPILNKLQ